MKYNTDYVKKCIHILKPVSWSVRFEDYLYTMRKIANLQFFFPSLLLLFHFIICFCYYKHLLSSSSLSHNIKVSCRNFILEIFLNGVSSLIWIPRPVSTGMGSVFPMHSISNSQTPLGCSIIQFNSDTLPGDSVRFHR